MQHRFLAEVDVAFDDLLDNSLRLRLFYFFLLVEHFHEVAVGTVLGDYVVEVFSPVCVIKLDNVGMGQSSMHFYLALEHGYVRCLKLLQIDHFYGISVIGVADVTGSVYFTAEPFAQHILLSIFIAPHSDVLVRRGAYEESLLRSAGSEGLEHARFLLQVLF